MLRKKAKLIADQLLIDTKVADEIVDKAIQIERTSGVSYYQMIRHDSNHLFLDEEEKQEKLAALNNKYFLLQDINIQTVLKECEALLGDLSDSEISKLNTAFFQFSISLFIVAVFIFIEWRKKQNESSS